MRRSLSLLGLLFVLALLGGLAWWRLSAAGREAGRFQTAAVVRGDLAETITANGTLNPVGVVNVGVQVSGTVQRLHADFNDRVRAGQLLLELDPRLFRARLAQSEANLARARAELELARTNRRRAEELVRRQFLSAQAYDQAVAAERAARAAVQAAEAAVAQDRANLEFSVVRSPVDGVVISRQVDVGQTVAASFQTPTLFTIARDLRRMQIEAAVAEADIGKVRVGQPVSFTVDAFGTRRFAGTVHQIRLNPTTQQNVVTFTVVIAVDNPDGVLLPGMTATASFRVRDLKDVLLVPNAALAFRPEGFDPRRFREEGRRSGPAPAAEGFPATVFVLGSGGEPVPRRVQVLASDDEMSAIAEGVLAPGDLVILADREAQARRGVVRVGPPPASGGTG
ncbi:MAG: efflux RND transporter periplasmic adaptor subunit [Sphingomonadaceae bacterium]|uniref:efflux RND transporter periplasmic adaptor subunit n=1 Tax=Thermaurantiacus sp. TaxID=2820283 RepID=UPI00298F1119|nr:efflux RND transporter periplasmic adaptor subunit [Thermaurantiacus sp.]MCS6987106.1 efflux RND transporter periplasmic adaptor subunit [Sphingomonadaceae bacterium]MDW8415556.1 efflux RND transporter periplasmic adaptor subunit [Thermaurantiacus sp.]